MHSKIRERDSAHWEATICRISVDPHLILKTTGHLYSVYFALYYSRNTTGVTDLSIQEGSAGAARSSDGAGHGYMKRLKSSQEVFCCCCLLLPVLNHPIAVTEVWS